MFPTIQDCSDISRREKKTVKLEKGIFERSKHWKWPCKLLQRHRHSKQQQRTTTLLITCPKLREQLVHMGGFLDSTYLVQLQEALHHNRRPVTIKLAIPRDSFQFLKYNFKARQSLSLVEEYNNTMDRLVDFKIQIQCEISTRQSSPQAAVVLLSAVSDLSTHIFIPTFPGFSRESCC